MIIAMNFCYLWKEQFSERFQAKIEAFVNALGEYENAKETTKRSNCSANPLDYHNQK